MNLKVKINSIISPILALQTWEDRIQHIIDLSKLLPDFPEELKTKDRLILGCQSNVWIDIYKEDARVYISGYADSVFVRGFLSLLIMIYSRETLKSIKEDQTDFMQQIGFQEMLNEIRGNGLLAIYRKIKNYN